MPDPTANDTARPECQEACECPDNYRKLCWAMRNPGVWPLTRERDAHLGAYVPQRMAPVEAYTARAIANLPDPAPAGLTAAQEIRLRLAVAWLTGTADAGEEARQVVLRWAEMCEHGADETPELEHVAESMATVNALTAALAAACPDPALHEGDGGLSPEAASELRRMYHDLLKGRDEARETVASQVLDMAQLVRERDDYASRLKATDQSWTRLAAERDDLKTELLEAHADLEASLAREQIAQERVARVLALLDHLDGLGSRVGHEEIRAILASDQGEEA